MKNPILFLFALLLPLCILAQDDGDKIASVVKQYGNKGGGDEHSKVTFILPAGKTMTMQWYWSGVLAKRFKIQAADHIIAEKRYEANKPEPPWAWHNSGNAAVVITVWCWWKLNPADTETNCESKYYSPDANTFYVGYSDTNHGQQSASEYTYREGVGKFTW